MSKNLPRYKRRRRPARRAKKVAERRTKKWCPISKALGYDVAKRIQWWYKQVMRAWERTTYPSNLTPIIKDDEYENTAARRYGIQSVHLGFFVVGERELKTEIPIAHRVYFLQWFHVKARIRTFSENNWRRHAIIERGAELLDRLLKATAAFAALAPPDSAICYWHKRCHEELPYVISVLRLFDNDLDGL